MLERAGLSSLKTALALVLFSAAAWIAAPPVHAATVTDSTFSVDPYYYIKLKATELKVALEPGSATDLYGYSASVARTGKTNLRYFRWTVPVAGVAKVRVQVLKHPNSPVLANWTSPTGQLASTTLAVSAGAGTNLSFALDFDKLDPTKPLTKVIFPIGTSAPLGYLWVIAKPPNLNPTPVYVRVIPLNASGVPVALPSRVVDIAFGNFKPVSTASTYTVPTLSLIDIKYFTGSLEAWDARCYGVVTKEISGGGAGTIPVGTKLNLCSSSSSGFLGSVWELATGSVDLIAAAYNGIQEAAVKLTVDLVGALTGCDGLCKDALRWSLHRAIDAGLASMGLPPELPNSDQLLYEGKDYLAQVTAEAMLGKGVAADVAADYGKKAVEELYAKMVDAGNHGADGTNWYRLDPTKQYHPPWLRITVGNLTGAKLPPEQLRIADPYGRFKFDSPVYVPSLKAGQVLTIPVYLKPVALDPQGWKKYLTTGGFGGPDLGAINTYVAQWNTVYTWTAQAFQLEVSTMGLTGEFGTGFGTIKALGTHYPDML